MYPLRSLRSITLAYGAAFALAMLTAITVVYVLAARSIVRGLDTRLSTEASALAGGTGKFDMALTVENLRRHEALRANADLSYLLVDPKGHALAGNLRIPVPAIGYSNLDYYDGAEGLDRGRALTTRLAGGVTLVIVADLSPVEDFNGRMLQISTILFAVTIVIGMLGALAFSRTIGRRIEANTRIAYSIINGELGWRMPYDGTKGAFDRQAAVLNDMLDRIQMLVVNLQQISSDVAHDIRTPLARLHSSAARLAARSGSAPDAAEIKQIVIQSEQILALFGAILRISEVEAGNRRRYFSAVDLRALTLEVIATIAPAIDLQGGRINAGHLDSVIIIGDRELIAQALINLIDNAGKYAGQAASISLSIILRIDVVALVVQDDGPGIPAEDHAKAMRRFGRLDSSRSMPGNGLGLSLVDAITRLHGGSFALHDAQPGLAATLTLPLNLYKSA